MCTCAGGAVGHIEVFASVFPWGVVYLTVGVSFGLFFIICVLDFQMSDVFNVISHDDDHMTFIWLSESSGYHHLELVQAQLSVPPASLFNRFLYQAQTQRKPLTTGPWVVMPTEVSRHALNEGLPHT